MPSTSRGTPLSDAERRKFFEPHGHIAHRYTMLWTHKLRFPEYHGLEHCHAICAFEASLLACRVFMEFLGLGISRKTGIPVLCEARQYAKPDDVKVTDLGGTFALLTNLSSEEQDLLAKVYHLADKANAHLTHDVSFMPEASTVHAALPVIDRLLRNNLYRPLGEEPRGHWVHPFLPSLALRSESGGVEAS